MTYSNELPHIDKIRTLANLIERFPATSSDILRLAIAHRFSKNMQDFIGLFPEESAFIDVDDFVNFAKDLETVIREERSNQPELSISP